MQKKLKGRQGNITHKNEECLVLSSKLHYVTLVHVTQTLPQKYYHYKLYSHRKDESTYVHTFMFLGSFKTAGFKTKTLT